ncbi:cytochrome C assembly family protein [Brevibacillus ginsengisoli]|uniref:cytochrome C assembly family protein n=1 Tax=Brevibacillus ginsengisoli TaxID=363854 RepID=UPI003CF5383F
MAEARWIYDLTIFLYAASVLFYFHDFLHRNQRANRIAFGLLAGVWVTQTVFFISQMSAKAYFPVLTLFETLFFYSWILVTLSLLINYFFRIDLLVFFTNLIGFSVMALSMFISSPAGPTIAHPEAALSELLFIHITMAIISYAAFSLSMICSGLFLLLHKMLKQKRWSPLIRRLPSLDQLERFTHQLNMLGVPLLLLSIILGTIWAHLVLHGQYWLDSKVWLSVIVLIFYSFWLYKWMMNDWQGRKLATWNMIAFVVLLINFLLSDISKFHYWT